MNTVRHHADWRRLGWRLWWGVLGLLAPLLALAAPLPVQSLGPETSAITVVQHVESLTETGPSTGIFPILQGARGPFSPQDVNQRLPLGRDRSAWLHLRVQRSGARWRCRLGDDEPVRRHRPSVDALFESVAQAAGANASAALLTGMGDDGARGLLTLRKVGAATIVQDEASSVVWGMPGAAYTLGAAQQVLPLNEIGHALLASTA